MPLTSQEIRQKYDRVAARYDWLEGLPEFLGLRKLRRELLQRASGRVLEIAAGRVLFGVFHLIEAAPSEAAIPTKWD